MAMNTNVAENMNVVENTSITISGIKSIEDLPVTLHVVDLMPLLDVGRNTAYELVRSGTIRSVRIGREYRVPREAVIEFLSGSAA